MKRRTREGLKWVRRGTAFALATLTLWGFLRTNQTVWAGGGVLSSMPVDTSLLQAALEREIGYSLTGDTGGEGLTFLEGLALGMSPLFGANQGQPQALVRPIESPEESPAEEETEEEEPQKEGIPITTPNGVIHVEELHQDDIQTPLLIPPDGDIVSTTLLATEGEGYLNVKGAYIHNGTSREVDVTALSAQPLVLNPQEDGPQVLILHTHGTEAYTPEGTDSYTESDPYRTTDTTQNIVRVGEEIASVLTEMGVSVLHDTSLYDYPDYNSSYNLSYTAVKEYLETYPTIQVVMDIHRDALVGSDGTIYKPITTINGEQCAQVMLVMGSDGVYSHPQWMENLSFAISLQQEMNLLWPTLARSISLKENRYNQQLSTGYVLVEIGSHGNTLQEALSGARMFARAAGAVLLRD